MEDIFEDIPENYETIMFNNWYSFIEQNVKNKKERLVWKRAVIWASRQKLATLITDKYIEFDFNSKELNFNVTLTDKLFKKFEHNYIE